MNPFQAYQQYSTRYPDTEQIGGMLYDTRQYLSGATVTLPFFNTVQAIQLSNMDVPNQLSNPKAFLIQAIRFIPQVAPRSTARAAAGSVTTGAVSDIALLINTGVLTLVIGSKPYAEFPLWMLPGGAGVFGTIGADGDAVDPGTVIDWATNGYPEINNVFSLTKPIPIVPQINFSVILTWPAGFVTLVSGNTLLQVIFDGTLVRPVQ